MKLTIGKDTGRKISEDMYGLFFEDINYGLDGGLHAEMLENRNFEAVYACGSRLGYTILPDGKYGWELYDGKGDGSALYIHTADPLNEVNPHYLVFQCVNDGDSFTNRAYDGLYVKESLTYRVSFYAKALRGNASVLIAVKKDGVTYAQEIISLEDDGKEWKQYFCTLQVSDDLEQASFVVSLDQAAVIAFDQFSMIPSDAVCGIFRRDLVEKLEALNPSFMRFPGGCVIEGNTLENRYQWKKSVGPAETRQFNWNRWAVHNAGENNVASCYYAHYGQTLGVGYYEYFLLCEHLKAKALPVLSVGLACQFMSTELVPADSEELESYIQDAIDLIEFANGSTDTTWGALRAKMGHPEPFGLEYLGVGNEQWETEDNEFFKRAKKFEQRIHAVYPEIKIIGTAGPDVSSEKYEAGWNFYRSEMKENPNCVHAVDEHYYVKPEWLYENVHFYDEYDRDVKVFAGEYACHIPGLASFMNCPGANTLGAALAEAAFLTGIERNADVVIMACYAPLFARLGYTQWSPDLIWFNGEKSYGTPSYYVQQMYSCNRGTTVCETDWTKAQEDSEQVYFSAVRDANGDVILKAVNASGTAKNVTVDGVNGASVVVTQISGDPAQSNSIYEPERIAPATYEMTGTELTLQPNSFAVIRFQAV